MDLQQIESNQSMQRKACEHIKVGDWVEVTEQGQIHTVRVLAKSFFAIHVQTNYYQYILCSFAESDWFIQIAMQPPDKFF